MEITEEQQAGIHTKAYPTVAQGWGILGYTVLVSLIACIPFEILQLFGVGTTAGWSILLGYVLPLLMVLWIASKYRKNNSRNRKGYVFKAFPVAIVPVLVMVTIALGILLEAVVGLVPMPDSLQEFFSKAVQPNVWGFLTVAVAAPLLEELLMRGVVLEGLLRNYEPRKAIIWSAVFFGVFHLNPWQFVAAFVSGCFIGWLYWKTDSLWPGIIVHFVNNALGFFTLVYFPDVDNFSQLIDHPLFYGVLLLFSVAMCLVGYVFLTKFLNRRRRLVVSYRKGY